jgi:hypothetical protein
MQQAVEAQFAPNIEAAEEQAPGASGPRCSRNTRCTKVVGHRGRCLVAGGALAAGVRLLASMMGSDPEQEREEESSSSSSDDGEDTASEGAPGGKPSGSSSEEEEEEADAAMAMAAMVGARAARNRAPSQTSSEEEDDDDEDEAEEEAAAAPAAVAPQLTPCPRNPLCIKSAGHVARCKLRAAGAPRAPPLPPRAPRVLATRVRVEEAPPRGDPPCPRNAICIKCAGHRGSCKLHVPAAGPPRPSASRPPKSPAETLLQLSGGAFKSCPRDPRCVKPAGHVANCKRGPAELDGATPAAAKRAAHGAGASSAAAADAAGMSTLAHWGAKRGRGKAGDAAPPGASGDKAPRGRAAAPGPAAAPRGGKAPADGGAGVLVKMCRAVEGLLAECGLTAQEQLVGGRAGRCANDDEWSSRAAHNRARPRPRPLPRPAVLRPRLCHAATRGTGRPVGRPGALRGRRQRRGGGRLRAPPAGQVSVIGGPSPCLPPSPSSPHPHHTRHPSCFDDLNNRLFCAANVNPERE